MFNFKNLTKKTKIIGCSNFALLSNNITAMNKINLVGNEQSTKFSIINVKNISSEDNKGNKLLDNNIKFEKKSNILCDSINIYLTNNKRGLGAEGFFYGEGEFTSQEHELSNVKLPEGTLFIKVNKYDNDEENFNDDIEKFKKLNDISDKNNIVLPKIIITYKNYFTIQGYEIFDYDLHVYLRKGNQLLKNAVKIYKDIINGVCILHNNDIVHGDLKTENVLVKTVNNNNIVMAAITDFGFLLSTKERLTMYGTGDYFSHEMIDYYNNIHKYNDFKGFDSCSQDMWALGIIGLELFFIAKNQNMIRFNAFNRTFAAIDTTNIPRSHDLGNNINKYISPRYNCKPFINELSNLLFNEVLNLNLNERIKIDNFKNKFNSLCETYANTIDKY